MDTDLNVQVHEKVMGLCAHVLTEDVGEDHRPREEYAAFQTFRCVKCGEHFNHGSYQEGQVLVPNYSGDVALAWKVWTRCFEEGKAISLTPDLTGDFWASIHLWALVDGERVWMGTREVKTKSQPVAMMICRAAVYPI